MLRFFLLFIAIGILFLNVNAAGNNKFPSDASSLYLENAAGEHVLLDNENAKRYIEKFLHIAISEMDRSGIPASIKLAQGILESGSGMSSLAKYAHNHFGIKCGGSWKGKTYYLWDDDVVKSCFRVFDKDEDSYMAHTEFIASPNKSSRYGFLFDYPTTDYKAWAHGLQKAGYATSKTYAWSLISIIERYELYRLDHLTFRCMTVTEGELDSIFQHRVLIEPIDTMLDEPHFVLIPDPFGNLCDTVRMTLSSSTFKVNNLLTVYVQEGDNLEMIAKRYNLNSKKLEKYNELEKGYVLRTGQYIFLEPKKNKFEGDESYHIVRRGQKIFDVAQYYGIKKNELQKINKVYKNCEPQPGTLVRLKKEK
jgi:LysM repeat protein